MIPEPITRYLNERGVTYTPRPHPTTFQAHELAHELEVTEPQVAKSVAVEVDGAVWLAVVPATDRVDCDELAAALHADSARVLEEDELRRYFPGCELGAAPPFGSLYGMPVAADRSLTEQRTIVFNGGTHREAIEMSTAQYTALEQPTVATFGVSENRN